MCPDSLDQELLQTRVCLSLSVLAGASKAKAAVSKAQPGSASKKRARKSSLQKAAQAEPVALDDTDLELDLADDELVAAEQVSQTFILLRHLALTHSVRISMVGVVPAVTFDSAQ